MFEIRLMRKRAARKRIVAAALPTGGKSTSSKVFSGSSEFVFEHHQ
jgi:hypothetical protein